MKAIIPVAGAGTRLRPHTYTQPKALIPVAGKPILDFIIDQLKELGINEFVFILGYLGEKITSHVDQKYPDIKAHYALQAERLGVGHAIWTAKKFIEKDEDVLIVLGDTIIRADLERVIKSPKSSLGVKKVDDPWRFGVVEFNRENKITGVVEKPKFPKSNMALVGVYKITETKILFDCLSELVKKEIAESEEIHLTDALMLMIQRGVEFDSFKVDNWYDCGKVEVLLETNAKLLKDYDFVSEDPKSYENAVIIQPVSIAKGTKIINSVIGPNVTVGNNTIIAHSILSNSIIGEFVNLDHIILKNSIIGSDTAITGLSQSLNIGDNTDINFSGEKENNA